MHIDIISVVPNLLDSPLSHSIMQRAKDKGLLSVAVHDLREYGLGKHRSVDDYQFGGGAGMVMRCEPLAALIDKLMAERTYDEIIYLTPDGERYAQGRANQLSLGTLATTYCLVASWRLLSSSIVSAACFPALLTTKPVH